MSASVRAATSGPAANRNREAWPASPGPGAPSKSCCPARWEAPAGATACSRRERPSLFRALHATNASRQVSGASSPMSAASTATLRTAVIRAMDTEPSPGASRAPSHAFTVALVKPDSGSSPNHSVEFAERRIVHPPCNRGRTQLPTLSRSCSVLYYRHS